MNPQKVVNAVGILEKSINQTPTYDLIFGGSNWPQIKETYKRQVLTEEEKLGVSFWELSLQIELGHSR